MAFGVWTLGNGIIGLLYPTPLPILSSEDRVWLEIAEETQHRQQARREQNPTYKLALLERHFRPVVEELGKLFVKTLGKLGWGSSARKELERQLDLVDAGGTVAGFYGQKFATGTVAVTVFGTLELAGLLDLSLAFLAIIFAGGFWLPNLALKQRVQ